jgi:lipopolysaccharide export LptBFGC system permease protein LptF
MTSEKSDRKMEYVFKTFLWSFAYGFFLMILMIIMSLIIGGVSNQSATIGAGLGFIGTIMIIALRAWLLYGTAFDYGYTDGLESCLKNSGQSKIVEQIGDE